MALRRVWLPSPNYSGRGGSGVRLVVLHTAEGATSYQSLGAFFANPSSGVSSHVGIDDTPNTVGEYVRPEQKAWTQGNANAYSVSCEMCAFAKWTPTQWNAHPVMLDNTAQWVAEECARFGIPMRALTAAQAQGGQAGVCDHAALGAAGGGHWDIGSGITVQQILDRAGAGPAQPKESEDQMGLATAAGKTGRLLVEVDAGGNLWGKVQEAGSARWSNAHIGKGLDPNRLPAASVGEDGQMDAYATKQGGGVFHQWWQKGRGWAAGETMA